MSLKRNGNKRSHSSDSDDDCVTPPPKALVTRIGDTNNTVNNTNHKQNDNLRMRNNMSPVVVLNSNVVTNFMNSRKSLGVNVSASESIMSEVNDSNEKQMRYKNRMEFNKRSIQSPVITTPARKSLGPTAAAMNPQQLKDHYAICIKLSASNKINSKNAFGLHLIDYMSDLLRTSHDGQMNFKLASSALDAGAKIYCHRVDYVHAEAQKVAIGLAMALDSKDSKGNDNVLTSQHDDGDHSGPDDDPEPKPKRKKIIKRNVITVVQNVETLNFTKIESNYQIDPVFHHLSTEFDMGNVNGLLMVNLKVNVHGMMMLDSNSSVEVDNRNEIEVSSSIQQISQFYNELKDISKGNDMICPKLANFEFLNRDVPIDMFSQDEPFTDPQSNLAFDLNAEVEDINDLDMDAPHDYFDDGESGSADGEHMPETAHKSLIRAVNMVAVKDLANILSDKPSDYTYFNQKFLGNTWAGPNHWKKCNFQRGKKPNDGEPKTRKQRKQYTEFNFVIHDLSDDHDKTGAADLKLTLKTLRKWHNSRNDLQLPEDHGFDPKNLGRSFIKRGETFHSAKSREEILDLSIPDMEDDGNFRPESAENRYDDDDDPNSGAFPPFDDMGLAASVPMNTLTQNSNDPFAFVGDNLIEQPYDINQINLPYAKFAKKMDVKRLKRAMWELLATPEPAHASPIPAQTPLLKMNSKLYFTDLYQTLPKKITPLMSANLSGPIAFVTLLHLCNERNLHLNGRDDLSDFSIEQPNDNR